MISSIVWIPVARLFIVPCPSPSLPLMASKVILGALSRKFWRVFTLIEGLVTPSEVFADTAEKNSISLSMLSEVGTLVVSSLAPY